MSEILDFMLSHWQLSSLLVLLIAVYVGFELKQSSGGRSSVSADQAVDMYNHNQAVFLDIRPQDLFSTGHVMGATHVDVSESDIKLKKFTKYAERPVIIISADGKDADRFAARLSHNGLKQVLCLAGGIKAWQSAGLPLTNNKNKNT